MGCCQIKGPVEVERLYLAAGIGVAVFGAFFIAVLARSMFGGTLYDQNGYQPFKAPVGPGHWQWDVNVTVFSVLTAILLLGTVLI
jgi:hypothetical protein